MTSTPVKRTASSLHLATRMGYLVALVALLVLGYAFVTASAPGSRRSARTGTRSLERRKPDPIHTQGRSTASLSTQIGQSTGVPTAVMPPYSIPVRATA